MGSQREITQCPYCGADVSRKRLESHLQKRCPRRKDNFALASTTGESSQKTSKSHATVFLNPVLANQRVVFTGQGPFEPRELAKLIPTSVVWTMDHGPAAGTSFDVIVVGHRGYSRNFIRALLKAGRQPPRFLPQEGFIDELLFGNNWWTGRADLLNKALETHKGLSCAKFFFKPFSWPGTYAAETQGGRNDVAEFRETTPLYDLGYKIDGYGKDARQRRWTILTKVALPKLGLREVAYTIARHCRLRKSRKDGRRIYARAIEEWEHDLARLKKEHYDKQRGARFTWPSIETRK